MRTEHSDEQPQDERLKEAAVATALGDEVPPDPEELWLGRYRDATLLVMGVVAHGHGMGAREIRHATGQWPGAERISLNSLRRAGLVVRERRPGPDHWFATRDGLRLGIVPYVTRLLAAVTPRFRGHQLGWSVGRFAPVGTEHGPPVFRPSFTLAKVDDPAALAEVIRNGTDDDRTYALTKLIALDDPAAVPALREIAQRHGDDELLARRAVGGLGHFATPESIDALLDLAATRDSIIREAAARSLGRLRVPQAIPTLLRLLSYPSALVRAAAVTALGRIGERSVAPQMAGALGDRDAVVRHCARHALIRLGATHELMSNPRRLWPLRLLDGRRARHPRV